MMFSHSWPHPLPISPIKGEVMLHSFNAIQFQAQAATSPFGGEVDLQGRAGEGAFPSRQTRPPHPALRADLSPRGRGEERIALP